MWASLARMTVSLVFVIALVRQGPDTTGMA